MSYFHHTNVPNVILDTHLQNLGYAELKVLLVIIRQTHGWINKNTGKQKEWDWISNQFFVKKTGLSRRAVTDAITKLLLKNLIQIKNEKGIIIHSSQERKFSKRIYYHLSTK